MTCRDLLWGLVVVCMALAWFVDARVRYGSPAVSGTEKACPQCGCRDEGHALGCPVVTAFVDQRIREALHERK